MDSEHCGSVPHPFNPTNNDTDRTDNDLCIIDCQLGDSRPIDPLPEVTEDVFESGSSDGTVEHSPTMTDDSYKRMRLTVHIEGVSGLDEEEEVVHAGDDADVATAIEVVTFDPVPSVPIKETVKWLRNSANDLDDLSADVLSVWLKWGERMAIRACYGRFCWPRKRSSNSIDTTSRRLDYAIHSMPSGRRFSRIDPP